MQTVDNMKYLGGLDAKNTSGGGFSLKFDGQKVELVKLCTGRYLYFPPSAAFLIFSMHFYVYQNQKKQANRKEKEEEEAWALSRFYPMIEVSAALRI